MNLTDEKALKVLVVEDDIIDSKQMDRLLQRCGLSLQKVERVSMMKEALAELAKAREAKDYFDIVLLDLNLPDSNGLDTLCELHEKFALVPIVVVTGEGRYELGLEAVSQGAQDFLVKGEFDSQDLMKSIYFSVERKKTERELKRNELRFRTMIASIPCVIYRCVIDDGRTVQFVSNQVEELTGYTPEEFICVTNERSLGGIIYPDDHKAVFSALDKACKNNEPFEMDYRIIHRDGSIRWVHEKGQASYDSEGNPLYFDGAILDVTERREMEATIAVSEEKYRSVVDHIGIGICTIDQNKKILTVNNQLTKWFPAINEGSDLSCFQVFNYMPGGTCVGCPTCETLKDGQPHENIVKAKVDGKIHSYRIVSSALKDNGGNVIAAIQMTDDITDQIEAKEALESAHGELQDAYKNLKEMQLHMVQSEKLASIGQLAAGVAHEMNTPVGFVACNFDSLYKYMGKIKELLSLYEKLADEAQKSSNHAEMVKVIEEAREQMHFDFIMEDLEELFADSKEGLERVTGIIQNLRDFSRVDQATDVAKYDINKGIESTMIVARNEIKYDAEVHTDFGEVPHIEANSGQINQVFLVMFVNAAQAIREQAREERGNIWVKTYADDEWVVAEISDDGPGIAPDVVQRVFEPFFTTKAPGKGTGLGLSVSYDIIVNKHKGGLMINSNVGKGTTFIVKLPIQPIKTEEKQEQEVENHGTADCTVC